MIAVGERLRNIQTSIDRLGQSFRVPRRMANARDLEGSLVVSHQYLADLQQRGESHLTDAFLEVMGDWTNYLRDESVQVSAREEAAQARALSRRAFLGKVTWLTGGLATLSALSVVNKVCISDPNSPERWAEWEAQNALGGQFTGVSARGWALRYPPEDPKVAYSPSEERGYFYVDDKTFIDFERTGVISNHTGVKIGKEYTTTKGKIVPDIFILKPGSEQNYYRNDVLLLGEPVPGLDTSVLEFHNVNTRQSIYARLSKESPDSVVYKVQLMDRQEPKQP